MATFTVNPEIAFDIEDIDLNFYVRYDYDTQFHKSVNFVLDGVAYPDVLLISADDGNRDLLFGVGGHGIIRNFGGEIIGGTVTRMGEEDNSLFGDGTYWSLAGVSLSAVSVYQALQTAGNGDDFAVIAGALAGADTITLSDGNDRMGGFAGNDTILGLAGNDFIMGGSGDDTIDAGAGGDRISGGPGNDHVTGGEGSDIIDYSGSSVLSAVAVDLVLGTATGGGGTDTLEGVEGVLGSGWSDWMNGNDLASLLAGYAGDDALFGNGGNDFLQGGAGNDFLSGGTGDDGLHGEAGNDIYLVDSVADQVFETVTALYADTTDAGGTDIVRSTVSFDLAASNGASFVENLVLEGGGNINARGNALANILVGNSGANLLDGRGGADIMRGAGGNDSYFVDVAADRVSELADGGIDRVTTLVNHTLASNFENLVLGGSASLNGAGNDLANTLVGNAAANLLDGRSGADVLRGQAGADRLIGGLGRDILLGGADGDSDAFIFRAVAESTPGALRDLVHDFTSGTDTIDLRAIDANSGLANNQAFAFSASGPAAHSVWVIDIGAHLIVRADVSGDTIADFEFQLMNTGSVLASDFLL